MPKWISFLFLTACFESDADKLVRLKSEQNTLIDQLYAAYGGSDLANLSTAAAGQAQAKAAEQNTDGSAIINTLAQLATGTIAEVDRAAFEASCMAIGNGDRPATLSQNAKTFFAKPEVKEGCLAYGRLDREISELEKKVAQ